MEVATMTGCVRIDYTLKRNVDLEDTKAAIAQFVDGIMNHHPNHRYMSFQHSADDRHFTHFGELVSDVVADLQTKPFFREFSVYLRERCSLGPEATSLEPVASTTSNPVIFKASNKDVNPESEEKNHAA
jgi:hypothetical protein